jgi:hypothetical protein
MFLLERNKRLFGRIEEGARRNGRAIESAKGASAFQVPDERLAAARWLVQAQRGRVDIIGPVRIFGEWDD